MLRSLLATVFLLFVTACAPVLPVPTPPVATHTATSVPPTWTPAPTSTRYPAQATYTPYPTSTPRPTYTMQPTYTALPTLTNYPTATPTATDTPRATQERWQRTRPIPTPGAGGIAVASYAEYQCYEKHFYGIADGHDFWIHDEWEQYALCVAVAKSTGREVGS